MEGVSVWIPGRGGKINTKFCKKCECKDPKAQPTGACNATRFKGMEGVSVWIPGKHHGGAPPCAAVVTITKGNETSCSKFCEAQGQNLRCKERSNRKELCNAAYFGGAMCVCEVAGSRSGYTTDYISGHGSGHGSGYGSGYGSGNGYGSDAVCQAHEWPDRDHGLVCGPCKVLVNNFRSKYKVTTSSHLTHTPHTHTSLSLSLSHTHTSHLTPHTSHTPH